MKTAPQDRARRRSLDRLAKLSVIAGILVTPSLSVFGQATPAGRSPVEEEEETIVLSPFVVDASEDSGYRAASTLAGTRIRSDLADIGSAISVITKEMMTDLGATNSETLLAYALNTEVGGPRGNFSGGVPAASNTYSEHQLFTNPNANTRVRGLTAADNTRNFFVTDIPWDGYTVGRVDLQRGPNAILFGLGSPAGVVNASTNVAQYGDSGSVGVTFDEHGSRRIVFDFNRELVDDELAARVTLLANDQKFQQRPAFSNDRRMFAAAAYKPVALNRKGTRFEISGNFERGDIDSNRPRIVAPVDRFSAFWDPVSAGGVNRQIFNPIQTPRVTDSASTAYVPSVTQVFASKQINLLVNANRSQDWVLDAVDAYRALRADGTVIDERNADANGPWPRANAFGRLAIKTLNEYAGSTGVGLPFASFGGYRAETFTDSSVFDFYDRLLDGDNKREATEWNAYETHVTNTFFNDTLGYDLSYFAQRLDRGQWSALGWDNTIYMDINSVNIDGSANPDVGRAYVNVESRIDGNEASARDRDAWRVQLFGEYDFAGKHEGWWSRLLGVHRLTGVMSEEAEKADVRQRKYWGLDPASLAQFSPQPFIYGADGDNGVGLTYRHYVSGDLRGRDRAAGSDLASMSRFLPQEGGPISIYRFDNTWTAPASVDPGAAWVNPNDSAGTYTQSHNPANYRGWTETSANLVTLHSNQLVGDMTASDYLTYSGTLSDFDVDSKILVWQGYFWDRAVVGTYGYREDDARKYDFYSGSVYGHARDTGSADLRPSVYNYDNPDATVDRLSGLTSKNWSVAVHLNRLLGKRDFLPVNVSLYYNEGENFQPLAGRFDAFGQPLDPPQGSTEEQSVLLSTKDGKYSLRATKYETDIYNASSTGRIGNMWAFEQEIYFSANMARDFRAGRADTSQYTGSGGDLNRLNNEILPAWFQFEKDLKTQFPDFVASWFAADTTWGTDNNGDVRGRSAPGFAYTEDSHSEGYEFELTANPTANWRLAFNTSQTKASRENVPGVAFKQVVDWVDDKIQNTDVGRVPIWWPGNVQGGRVVGPYTIFRPDYLTLQALNGQSQSEVREWRANFITNYSFTEARLKGVGLGGGYRWEDKGIIDYAPKRNEDGSYTANLDAPFYTPSQSTVDLWVSYQRRLSDKLNWKIQLNVYNAFGSNELVPFRASVDYEKLGGTTITPTTVVPMKASAFTIKEGMTWQIVNTFEF